MDNEEKRQVFSLNKEDVEAYGDDYRAIIKAFAEKIGEDLGSGNETLRKRLEFLKEEINWILENEA